ncbi:hypothetical protein [Terasakiella sp. SH-1]|uniref:hypothetical protein n=1 Tax=Terasakiella sp. SH-1 TaxID=2560057 RepID=UPI001073CE96|nr:hypothetical protein [Terasakiella sp. SH-1]
MKIASFLAFLLAVAALTLWYQDGAWQNGDMPTKGMIKTTALSALAVLCFYLAKKFRKAS